MQINYALDTVYLPLVDVCVRVLPCVVSLLIEFNSRLALGLYLKKFSLFRCLITCWYWIKDSSTSWDEDEEEDDEDECDDESHNELLSTDGDNGNSKTKSTMSISSLPNPRTVIHLH